MPLIVTLQQAARNALATWLTSELSSVPVTVEPRWAEPDRQLRPKHITIIDAGPRDLEWLQPEVLYSTLVDLEGGNSVKKVDAVWSFGYATMPVQLDVWAQSDVGLDDIIARLDASLNKGTRGVSVQTSPFDGGLALNLGDGWSPGIVHLEFGQATLMQSPGSVIEGEWRAMYRGTASAQMTQAARTARIARILLEQRLRVQDPINTADTPDETIITAASF